MDGTYAGPCLSSFLKITEYNPVTVVDGHEEVYNMLKHMEVGATKSYATYVMTVLKRARKFALYRLESMGRMALVVSFYKQRMAFCRSIDTEFVGEFVGVVNNYRLSLDGTSDSLLTILKQSRVESIHKVLELLCSEETLIDIEIHLRGYLK